MVLQETGCDAWTELIYLRIWASARGCCKRGDEPTASIKCRGFLHYLQLLSKNFAAWSQQMKKWNVSHHTYIFAQYLLSTLLHVSAYFKATIRHRHTNTSIPKK
jgi:hypothetical protein